AGLVHSLISWALPCQENKLTQMIVKTAVSQGLFLDWKQELYKNIFCIFFKISFTKKTAF
ncbi:MAG TPA: hypothetical protein DCM08_00610, partial [Microscillaceae bacterium]|nr:hypothetical protein [Microscillaceae bacterium]